MQKGAGDLQVGMPVIRFDGVDDLLTINSGGDLAQPNTVWVVWRLYNEPATGGGDIIFDGVSGKRNTIMRYPTGLSHDRKHTYFAGTTTLYGSELADETTGWNISKCYFNGGSSALFLNGVSDVTGDAGAMALNNPRLGSDDSGAGKCLVEYGETIIYNATVSGGDTTLIDAYLADKWS